jgi:hypothetical protein
MLLQACSNEKKVEFFILITGGLKYVLFILFVFYLVTLSVAQTILRHMIG